MGRFFYPEIATLTLSILFPERDGGVRRSVRDQPAGRQAQEQDREHDPQVRCPKEGSVDLKMQILNISFFPPNSILLEDVPSVMGKPRKV